MMYDTHRLARTIALTLRIYGTECDLINYEDANNTRHSSKKRKKSKDHAANSMQSHSNSKSHRSFYRGFCFAGTLLNVTLFQLASRGAKNMFSFEWFRSVI